MGAHNHVWPTQKLVILQVENVPLCNRLNRLLVLLTETLQFDGNVLRDGLDHVFSLDLRVISICSYLLSALGPYLIAFHVR